ncbi:MAG TPA: hypothetical protein VFV25_09045, partial [Methylibium sp.]
MDMSDLGQSKRGGGIDAVALPADDLDNERWRALITRIGCEIAEPLSAALERIIGLATSGSIDTYNLRALRREVEHARKAGIASQQLARFASGRLKQSHERLHLTQTLQSVLGLRTAEVQARGIQVKQVLRPVEVIVDPSLLFSLLNT